MKKLVSTAVCLLIGLSIHAQTQSGTQPQKTDRTQVERTSEAKPAHQCDQHKAVQPAAAEAVAPKPHVCPHAASCPKAQAAAAAENNQGEAKKPACCAKHQGEQSSDVKPEQKTGCNHQNAEQKAGCNHNHGTADKTASPQKKGKKK